MNIKHLSSIIPAIAMMIGTGGCSSGPVERTDSGIVVTLSPSAPDEVRKVRLTVYNPSLIGVSATPEKRFADSQSLVIDKVHDPSTHFTVEQDDSTATVVTDSLRASVSLVSGNVAFYSIDGTLLAREEARKFSPICVEGKKGWTIRQTFESLWDDEGLYGLGQHQADEFNYKGRDEELFQYNTKVSVPFIVSTKGYGILWDSYSLCRFGNPEPYRQIGQVFTLFDKYGTEGALTGTYTPSSPDDGNTLERREDSIYFEHLRRKELKHVVNLPEDFKFRGSHISYEGEIQAPASGEYRFNLYYSGYISVWIDDKNVVPERWRTSWNPNAYKFRVELEAGKRVPVRIEWEPNGDVAYCGLRAYPLRPQDEVQGISWWGEMQSQEDYYFLYGSTPDRVIAAYRTLTGKAPIMPKWAMGFWQSREKYNTQAEVLGTLAEFRRRGIPIDNIVIDWMHWRQDAWGSHEFDPERFPDPKGMVDSIHALHGRVMVSVWPKFYVTTDHFKEFDRKGWMYRLPVTDSIRDWVGPGYLGSFYDAYSPEARKLFWSQINDHYVPLGIDAWWMDASEPNIRDCTDIQYRKDLITPTALGPSTQYFNAYGLMNADAIYRGQRSVDPDRRVFLLTRSGFAGQQRYSTATWSGDIATRWEDLKAQISAGLNFAISGIPWWSMDIGGFCVEDRYVRAAKDAAKGAPESADLKEWRELNTRWYQFGAFAPLFRAHGQYPFREPYNIAPDTHPAYRSILFYTRLRYELMPYIYSLAGMTHLKDYTLMRPLIMDFPDSREIYSTGDQYMFGPAIMVAPVYEYGARRREVVLPAGSDWYDFYTSELYTGGPDGDGGRRVAIAAPYERIPLLVKAGSIIPFGPDMQYTDEKTPDIINLYIYPGTDGADFLLYEDDGVSYNYEKGRYTIIPLHWDDASSTLSIGDRQGEYPGMLRNRRFNVVKISPKDHRAYSPDTKGVEVAYNGKAKKVKL